MRCASSALFTSAARREGVNVSFATPIADTHVSGSYQPISFLAINERNDWELPRYRPYAYQPVRAVQIGYAKIHYHRVEGFFFQLVKSL